MLRALQQRLDLLAAQALERDQVAQRAVGAPLLNHRRRSHCAAPALTSVNHRSQNDSGCGAVDVGVAHAPAALRRWRAGCLSARSGLERGGEFIDAVHRQRVRARQLGGEAIGGRAQRAADAVGMARAADHQQRRVEVAAAAARSRPSRSAVRSTLTVRAGRGGAR